MLLNHIENVPHKHSRSVPISEMLPIGGTQIGENELERQGTESGGSDGTGEGGQLAAGRSGGVAGAELSAGEAGGGRGIGAAGPMPCSTATAGEGRTVRTRQSFGGGCWSASSSATRISVRR